MRNRVLFIVLLLTTAVSALAESDRIMVRTTGQASVDLPNAREAAIEEALRQAVEIGGGVLVSSLTEVRDFQLLKDVIYTQTAGLVETYKVLKENPNQEGAYTVRVEAIISRGELNTKIEAWKALIRRKGKPRLMVVGTVDKQPFNNMLTAKLQGIMERRNLTVVDLEMLSENQRRNAERAAKGDLDPTKAALIIREVGADYLVIVSVEGTQYPPEKTFDVEMHTVDATGILKVVAADTAEVIASQVVNRQLRALTSQQATREATSYVVEKALAEAIGRLGGHWLEDVDQRSGQEIYIVASSFTFERLNQLIQDLRKAGGTKDIIVDSTDQQGRSQIRVTTNNSAMNIAAVLKQIDPGIVVSNISKNRIEISPGKTNRSVGINNRQIMAVVCGAVAVIFVILALVKLTRKQPTS